MTDYISPAESNYNGLKKSQPKIPSIARRQQAREFSHKVTVPPFMDGRAIKARMEETGCTEAEAEEALRQEWLQR